MMKHYVTVWVRPDGLYHSRTLTCEEAKRWEGKTIKYHGHNYTFTTKYVSRLVGWYPWQTPSFNPFRFFLQWLERRFVSVGFLYFREHPDPLHSQVIPDVPVTFSKNLSKGDLAVNPSLFRQVVTQRLYKDYNKKNPWGGRISSNMVIILVIAGVAIVILLALTGNLPGMGAKP